MKQNKLENYIYYCRRWRLILWASKLPLQAVSRTPEVYGWFTLSTPTSALKIFPWDFVNLRMSVFHWFWKVVSHFTFKCCFSSFLIKLLNIYALRVFTLSSMSINNSVMFSISSSCFTIIQVISSDTSSSL